MDVKVFWDVPFIEFRIAYDFLQIKESQDGYFNFERIFKTMCDNVQVCNKV